MTTNRDLRWDGGYNVRDLGELPTVSGSRTRWGAVVRSAALTLLSDAGWAALCEHGIRTVIDLTNPDERHPDLAARPEGVTTLCLPLDPTDDPDFWDYWTRTGLFGTPLYYRPLLERCPHRVAEVVYTIAHARPGGVLIHCNAGRDRAGLVSLVLLACAGVAAETIAEDHVLSHERVRPLFAKLGRPDQGREITELLARYGTTERDAVLATLDGLDVPGALRAGGLTDADLTRLRTRLLN